MIIYDILLILQHQVSFAVMNLVVVFTNLCRFYKAK